MKTNRHTICLELPSGLEAEVIFDFYPGDEEILYPNDAAQPGTEPEIDIESVIVNELDILNDLSDRTIEIIQLRCAESTREYA